MSSNPPYAAIERLVDFIMRTMEEDFNEKETSLGPIANRDHICYAAADVQAWLDANLMTEFALTLVK